MDEDEHEFHGEPPEVVDEAVDLFGAETAVAQLLERLQEVAPGDANLAEDRRRLLSPPFAADRDRVDGSSWAQSTLVVFGAFGTPASRHLGALLTSLRDQHVGKLRVAWRHYPDPAAHPRASVLALAAEAGASLRGFWPLAHELLRLRHDDPRDLHTAIIRAGLDPARTLAAMRAGTGIDRIVDDVVSAHASGVTSSPALFVNGERYDGALDPAAVSAALPSA